MLTSIFALLIVFIGSNCVNGNCAQDDELTPKLTVSALNILLVQNQSFIDIEVNETLRLKCDGIEPLIWSTSHYNLYSNRSQFINLSNSFSGGKHISELTVSAITYRQIGLYSCHYRRGFNRKKVKLTQHNSIYVFVTDPEHLFAKQTTVFTYEHELMYDTLGAISTRKVSVCRPTSSFTRMNLWRKDKLQSNDSTTNIFYEMDVSPQSGIEFDSTHGFIINSIDGKIGQLKCVAMLNTTVQTAVKDLAFEDPLQYDPVIVDLNEKTFVVGDNFTLDCQIRRNHDSLKIEMDWNFKGQCFRNYKPRINKGIARSNSLTNWTFDSMNITVLNAQVSDSGVYECSASTWSAGSFKPDKSVSVSIQVN